VLGERLALLSLGEVWRVKFPKETTEELTDTGERWAGVITADAGDN
jgi:hypothetical protein